MAQYPEPPGGYPLKSDVALDESGAAAVRAQLNPRKEPITAYASDGAISPTIGVAVLTKGSAGAYTLAAPTAAQAGQELRIINGTAYAHVVTATDLIDDGVTGGAKDTLTFGAFVGSAITLLAYNLKWTVVSKNVVTVAAV